MTKDIIYNILEYISEETQLTVFNFSQNPYNMEEIFVTVESILNDVLTCILRGQCTNQTNSLLISELFAIICTH